MPADLDFRRLRLPQPKNMHGDAIDMETRVKKPGQTAVLPWLSQEEDEKERDGMDVAPCAWMAIGPARRTGFCSADPVVRPAEAAVRRRYLPGPSWQLVTGLAVGDPDIPTPAAAACDVGQALADSIGGDAELLA